MLDMTAAKVDLDLRHSSAERVGGFRGRGVVARSDQRGERRQVRRIVCGRRRRLLVVQRDEQDPAEALAHDRDDRVERRRRGKIVVRPPDEVGGTGNRDMAGDAIVGIGRTVENEEE